MKKLIALILTILCLTGCSPADPGYTLSYDKTERMTLYEEYECVAVYTKFTNSGEETVLPADVAMVTAFQNGVELSPLVPSEETNGYVQVDTKVQGGATANVVWIFQLADNSPVSIEFSDGQKFEEG